MMSNANIGISDPGTEPGQGHPNQRNVQFRPFSSQQQLMHHHHHSHSQQHSLHESSNMANITPKSQSDISYAQRSTSALPLSQHGQSSHQQQHSHYSHSSHYSSSPQPHQQHHQQRPPIPPATHHPRLHHSMSTGNISMAANASTYSSTHGSIVGVGGGGGGGIGSPNTPAKKKDPYATAWRTYSKIAEELQLLNPDGSLYPISKEAILKYLHHQSKRIKSSNLHWYVNGLKKHQENLGFPWDDVRYDEQVVSLLKELTLHPVMMSENGDDDGHGHTYGLQPNRQRQPSSGTYPTGKSGHHYSSSSIDTTRIANLSISQPPVQQHQHQTQHKQQSSIGSAFNSSNLKQHMQPQTHVQPQQGQQTHPSKPYYRSAPIPLPSFHARTPSSQETPYQNISGGGHHLSSSPSMGLQADITKPETHGNTASALTKRKRNEFGFKKRRAPTSVSMEGEEIDDDDIPDDDFKDDELDFDDRRPQDMEDSDMEDSNNYQPLKRRASTGTLLSQARASALPKQIPDQHGLNSPTYQKGQSHVEPNGSYGNTLHRQRSEQRLRAHSPDPLEQETSNSYMNDRREGPRVRGSPSDSMSSSSSLSSHLIDREPQQRHRHMSSGGITSPTTVGPLLSSSYTSSAPTGPGANSGSSGKTTVQFSEVVECAQLLQSKYGNKCKNHSWGCVEISKDYHLELTMKMYLDWAGLVASGRLTMDELPDLPEFRSIPPTTGGTLRRMASTPLTSIATSAALGAASSTEDSIPGSRRPLTSEDSSSSGSSQAYYGPYRSPSSSPVGLRPQHDKNLATEATSLLGRIRSPPDSSSQRSIPSPPPSHLTAGSLHGRARKMPSTPSLSQHIRQETPINRSQHPRHLMNDETTIPRRYTHNGSIVSGSAASSPPSEGEMSEEEEPYDEEEVDITNYALSPWATTPSAIAARARMSGNIDQESRQLQPRTPTLSTLSTDTSLKNNNTGLEHETSSCMVVDTEEVEDSERAVSIIGEIPNEYVTNSGVSEEITFDGTNSSVEAAARVLDSMIIGRASDSTRLKNIESTFDTDSRSVYKQKQDLARIQGKEEGALAHDQEGDSVMMET